MLIIIFSVVMIATGLFMYRQKLKQIREEKKKIMLQRLDTLLKSNPNNQLSKKKKRNY